MKTRNKHAGRGQQVAIALQGSFGHKYYAMGIMSALQDQGMKFKAGSGCVEMMLPLWLFFNQESIRDYFHKKSSGWESVVQSLASPLRLGYELASCRDYVRSFLNTPQQPLTLSHLFANCFGPPGLCSFDKAYFAGPAGQEFERLMRNVKAPVFTNALNARNFEEIYLYSGPLTEPERKRILGTKGTKEGKRHLLELTLERFIASGARAPYIAPIEVQGEDGSTQYWMEGAMRCNPPLNPLMDVNASQILLLRFFAKKSGEAAVDNQIELVNRYLESVFTAPLEKEIDMIKAVNRWVAKHQATGKKQVQVLDAVDHVPNFRALVENQLDCFSHFEASEHWSWEPMFNRGVEAGAAIAKWWKREFLPA